MQNITDVRHRAVIVDWKILAPNYYLNQYQCHDWNPTQNMHEKS